MCGGVSRTGRFLFNVSLFLQHGNWQIFNTTTNHFSYQTHLTSTPNVSLLGQELWPRKAGGDLCGAIGREKFRAAGRIHPLKSVKLTETSMSVHVFR